MHPQRTKNAPRTRPHVYATQLSSSQKAKLKARAHALSPVVQVGAQGLSRSVLAEINGALEVHELIKVQLPSQTEAAEKKDAVLELSHLLQEHTHVVGRLGRVVILYLEKKPDEAKLRLKQL